MDAEPTKPVPLVPAETAPVAPESVTAQEPETAKEPVVEEAPAPEEPVAEAPEPEAPAEDEDEEDAADEAKKPGLYEGSGVVEGKRVRKSTERITVEAPPKKQKAVGAGTPLGDMEAVDPAEAVPLSVCLSLSLPLSSIYYDLL